MLTGLFEPIKGKGAHITEQQDQTLSMKTLQYTYMFQYITAILIVPQILFNTLIEQSHGWF